MILIGSQCILTYEEMYAAVAEVGDYLLNGFARLRKDN